MLGGNDDGDDDDKDIDDVKYQENPDALVSGRGGKTTAGLLNFIESPLKPPRCRGDDQHIEEYDHECSNDFGICMYYDAHHESSFLNDGILDLSRAVALPFFPGSVPSPTPR